MVEYSFLLQFNQSGALQIAGKRTDAIYKPCSNPLCPNISTPNSQYCVEHLREKKRLEGQDRREKGNINLFYQSKAWRQLRQQKITQDPFCEVCLRSGITVKGRDIDHIVPMSAGGPELDMSNLQTLCHKCHSSKTGKEMGNRFQTTTCNTEIILVVGPPASGKSHYVRQHMTYGDCVVDIDELVRALSLNQLRDNAENIIGVALEIRSAIITAAIGKVARVWVIATGSTQDSRQRALGSHNAHQTIVMTTSRAECKARALERTGYPEWEHLIDEWFQTQDLG